MVPAGCVVLWYPRMHLRRHPYPTHGRPGLPQAPARFGVSGLGRIVAFASLVVGCAPNAPVPLEARQIRAGVEEQAPAFRRCFEAGLARNPNLAGQVVMRFVIDEYGSVVTASEDPVEDVVAEHVVEKPALFPDAEVTKCVLAHLRTVKFPPSGRTQYVRSFPLLLRARPSESRP